MIRGKARLLDRKTPAQQSLSKPRELRWVRHVYPREPSVVNKDEQEGNRRTPLRRAVFCAT